MANASKGQSRQPDWLDLFRCFRIACDPAKMWLGFLGAAFTILMLLLWLGLMLEVRQLADGTTSRLVLRHVRAGNSAGAYQALRTGVGGAWTGRKGVRRANRHAGGRRQHRGTLRGGPTRWRNAPSGGISSFPSSSPSKSSI